MPVGVLPLFVGKLLVPLCCAWRILPQQVGHRYGLGCLVGLLLALQGCNCVAHVGDPGGPGVPAFVPPCLGEAARVGKFELSRLAVAW